MKKLVALFLLSLMTFGFAIGQTVKKVDVNFLQKAPTGSYAIINTAQYDSILKNGFEKNHGLEDHGLWLKKPSKRAIKKGYAPLWVLHPDGFVFAVDYCVTIKPFDKSKFFTTVEITVPYGKVLLFKRGKETAVKNAAFGWSISIKTKWIKKSEIQDKTLGETRPRVSFFFRKFYQVQIASHIFFTTIPNECIFCTKKIKQFCTTFDDF